MNSEPKLLGLFDVQIIGECQINPWAELVERSSREKCNDWGIVLQNFHGFVTMSSFVFPRTDRERLELIVLLMNFLFFLDDVADRHDPLVKTDGAEKALRTRNSSLVEVFLGTSPPRSTERLHVACREIRSRFDALADPEWMRRFELSIRQHLLGIIGDAPDGEDAVATYYTRRIHDSGMLPTIDLIELANDQYLSGEERATPDVTRMVELCALYGSLTNDLFSYEKEVVTYGSGFNLIPVLMKAKGHDFEHAVHDSVVIINQIATEFLSISGRVLAREDCRPALAEFIRGIRDQFSASWYWQIHTPRYRSARSPFPQLRELLM